MEVKTITNYIAYAEAFDNDVNAALADGWRLVRREIAPAPVMGEATRLYAELVKAPELEQEERPVEPITWQEAVRVLMETCGGAAGCTAEDCPMYDWCEANLPGDKPALPPNRWTDPEGGRA